MEFPNLGENCSNDGCKKYDFLPIKCTKCGLLFCASHIRPENHECLGIELGPNDKIKSERNNEDEGSVGSIFEKIKREREPSSDITKVQQKKEISKEMKKRLELIRAQGAKSASFTKKSTPGLKENIFFVKKRAKGDSKIPEESRLYLKVTWGDRSEYIFVSKKAMIGGALDEWTELFRIGKGKSSGIGIGIGVGAVNSVQETRPVLRLQETGAEIPLNTTFERHEITNMSGIEIKQE